MSVVGPAPATPAQAVAAFDLGIKNLSYCVATFDISGNLLSIPRWANLNLLADGADSQSQTRCGPCSATSSKSKPASYRAPDGALLCKSCVKRYTAHPVLEIPGNAKVVEWRKWAATVGVGVGVGVKASKAVLQAQAATIRVMPYSPPKSKGVTLQQLLVGMEACLTAELPHLAAASRIRIENQPCEFAPHMKSVQIMLFTLLDHRLRTETVGGWNGTIEFANASVKTRGTAAAVGGGAAGKRSRKLAAIGKVTEILRRGGDSTKEQAIWWGSQVKQDDLADALLMCVDAAATS